MLNLKKQIFSLTFPAIYLLLILSLKLGLNTTTDQGVCFRFKNKKSLTLLILLNFP